MRIFITGAAGFIGYHVALHCLNLGYKVFGFDSVNDYYNPKIKQGRLKRLTSFKEFEFCKGLLEDDALIRKKVSGFAPDYVLHLAAQAGVRYSLENPNAYISSNIVGFQNVIETVRQVKPKNFIYASSSSVYGGLKVLPFNEQQKVDRPISLYAATKISNELIAKTYNHLFGIPAVGLRFFTVYGPSSRPDMALYKFARLMKLGKSIPVYNNGEMTRDFTYIDDIVAGIMSAIEIPGSEPIFNLGKGEPHSLLSMIRLLEENLKITAKIKMLPMQPGDVANTLADISLAQSKLIYSPKTSLNEGIKRFCEWFDDHSKSELFET